MNPDAQKALQRQSEAAAAFARWMIDAGEAFARLQLEAMRASLDQAGRDARSALEAPSPDKLLRMRGEMLAADARRVLEFGQRYTELALGQREQLARIAAGLELGMPGPEALPEPFRRMLDAARTVQESMSALAQQSTGMWEAHLRTAKQAIEQALARSEPGSPPKI